MAENSQERRVINALTPKVRFFLDLVLWSAAAPLAVVARVDVEAGRYVRDITIYALATAVIKAYVIYQLGLHRQRWRAISVADLEALLKAVGIAAVLFFFANTISFPVLNVPRSIPLIEGLLAVMLLGGIRLASRLIHEQGARKTHTSSRKRVLIIGAGETGTTLAREMFRHPESGLDPIGFLDDDPRKLRDRFLGLPVLGVIRDLPRAVTETLITEVLIAMPTAGGKVIRQVVDLAASSHVPYRIVPAYHEVFTGKVAIAQIRDVEVEDLLQRAPIQLNIGEIAGFLEGKIALVSGAGGSIGSEIVRQIARFKPKTIVLLDHFETGMYYVEREISVTFPDLRYHAVIANIQNAEKLDRVFKEYTPQVVFHAAAHKHVPLMEDNPDEAVLNNISGTQNMLDAALRYGVEWFVNISTDKAVKPSSVMGACKRVAELLVADAAASAKPGRIFVSVRFGNVLGSQGSVIPLFKEQIKRGGPVTVTHPEMTRFFMTIPEAAQLVLQAAGLRQTGVVYVLEMGEPVKIIDLASDLIRLSGLVPGEDIEIVFTGIRPGEKLHEQVLTDQESLEASKYEGILIARNNTVNRKYLHKAVADLHCAAQKQDVADIRRLLRLLIPTFTTYGTGEMDQSP